VIEDEQKLVRKMAPHLQKVMIVDSVTGSARLLAEQMRGISSGQTFQAADVKTALSMTGQVEPQLIFVDIGPDHTDGIDLIRKVRRSYTACRKAPIIAIISQPTAELIMAARDSGVHEFLRKPYNTRELLKRLEAVTLRQREWVEAMQYVGPDRRRFNSGDYTGSLKRKSDLEVTDQSRIDQALRIIKSSLLAIGADPAQALRSLRAQAEILEASGARVGNTTLTEAASVFHDFLVDATEHGVLNPQDTLVKAGPLLALLPKDEPRPVAKAS
jgi:two-component system, response regulator PdtaR